MVYVPPAFEDTSMYSTSLSLGDLFLACTDTRLNVDAFVRALTLHFHKTASLPSVSGGKGNYISKKRKGGVTTRTQGGDVNSTDTETRGHTIQFSPTQ